MKAAADDAGLQAALDNYTDKISALFTMSDDVKFGWTVIGAVAGSMWDKDFPMTKVSASEWKSDDFKVEEAGTYFVLFNESTGEVSLSAE